MSSFSQLYLNKKIEQVTISDVKRMIEEKISENYTLDYKALPIKKTPFSKYGKVISSFLNTKGGLLILGVSEKKKRFPDKVTWGKFSRETLVRNLFNIVDPWNQEIDIHTIYNPKDFDERIYLIDVPKSNNPPHMADGVYYYRNVYESIPMTESQVKGLYTSTYLAKDKITEHIIGPMFNLAENVHDNITYNTSFNEEIIEIINGDFRYLLYQLNDSIFIENVDDFFELLQDRNYLLSRYQSLISNIIKKVVERNLPKINRSLTETIELDAIEKQYLVLRYDREVISDSYSPSTETSNLVDSLLFKIKPREEILNRKHVKTLQKSSEILLLPGDQQNRRKLNQTFFNELYGEIEEEVDKTTEIIEIWAKTDQLKEMSRLIMEMCLEKM